MKLSEPLLLDSNILVYAHNEDSPLHSKAVQVIVQIIKGKIWGILSFQNLLEFYSIITDKKRVSSPVAPKVALQIIKQYLQSPFEIIYPNVDTNKIMMELLKKNNYKDGQIFDVFLISTMLSNNIRQIITANIKDFDKFDKIFVQDLKNFSI